jgi:ArsR family transcriptional regulator
MNLALADAQRVLACLGDPSRFRMVAILADGDRCVTDIAREVRLSQSCTTRHLQVLLRHSVVSRVRQGKRVLFRLRDDTPEMASLLEWALIRARPDAASGIGDAGVGNATIQRDRGTAVATGYDVSRATPAADPAAAGPTVLSGAVSDTTAGSPKAAAEDSELDPRLVPDLEDYLL